MNINDILNEKSDNLERTALEIKSLKKELRKYIREQKRAKSNASKESIQKQNIDGIKAQIEALRARGKKTKIELFAIESKVLEEELATRRSNATTITKLDNRYRFQFLFSKLRRFGNFDGYLAGRKEEADNSIKNYILDKTVRQYIKDNGGKNALYSKYDIDPNSKDSFSELKTQIIPEIAGTINLDEQLNVFKENVINGYSLSDSDKADRAELLKTIVSATPKHQPKAPTLNAYNDYMQQSNDNSYDDHDDHDEK